MSDHDPGNDPVRLTRFARGGGCAAKLKQQDLVEVLAQVPASGSGDVLRGICSESDVLVDRDHGDDAAVVRGTGDRALVLTADVIAPLVDEPEAFGMIAATNAMSDVWAMGGVPRFALNLAFFPSDELPLSVLAAILRGGARACERAGVAIVGGHTVRDPEVKYGLSVSGDVAPGEVLSNRTAAAGQAVILTKALGTGVISQAIKKGAASADEIAAAVASMTTPNGEALAATRGLGVTACTDVTGFGMLGHLRNLLRGSRLAATVDLAALPLLSGARAHAATGALPGGSKANRTFVTPLLRPDPAIVDGDERDLLTTMATDAQTSGGLLLCLPEGAVAEALAALVELGLPAARVATLRVPAAGEDVGTMVLR
ncbi:MAG: selenide, water dikinase SelD [Kofleriaceae bacterium]|nr:selenide, water dikinase SelD [Myxococcales bacterium]MCB9560483.1 selenide, water dikinase SelD [Kofleriaceae bacterium]